MMKKFEVGDKVRVRSDVTVKELRGFPEVTEQMWQYIDSGEVMTVTRFSDIDVDVKENDYYWNTGWLEIVEKAPKVEYFDARLITGFNIGDVKNDWIIENHGKSYNELSGDCLWFEGWFTTEKPEPLKIINGKVL